MTNHCTRCGALTADNNDIHCRRIFINTIKEIIATGNKQAAFQYYAKEHTGFKIYELQRLLYTQGGKIGSEIAGMLCTRCGVPTLETDNIHCRKKFAKEISLFISQDDLDGATRYYGINKHGFNPEDLKNFLLTKCGSMGPKVLRRYWEIFPRRPHCFRCLQQLMDDSSPPCPICRWIKCSCGACGCKYDKRKNMMGSTNQNIIHSYRDEILSNKSFEDLQNINKETTAQIRKKLSIREFFDMFTA